MQKQTNGLAVDGLVESNVISMQSGDGRYVNTLVIKELTGVVETDERLKDDAVAYTRKVIDLIVDEHNGMTSQELEIFNKCVNQVYQDFGVTSDPATWYRSKDCTFSHLYEKAVELRGNSELVQKYNEFAVFDFIIKLNPYFKKGGIKTHWFKEPITTQQLETVQTPVFDFGEPGRETTMVDSKFYKLRKLFVEYLTGNIERKRETIN